MASPRGVPNHQDFVGVLREKAEDLDHLRIDLRRFVPADETILLRLDEPLTDVETPVHRRLSRRGTGG
jgi:hypothetical protein